MSGESISAAILAGGLSSRMGTNKAFVEIGGVPLIERIIQRLAMVTSTLVIIANAPEHFSYLGLPVFPDVIPGKAALGGIYSALSHAEVPHTLIVSCDQPFLNIKLLQYMSGLREGYDVVVPLDRENYPQSMHAIYSRACIEPIKARLDADRLKVIGFFPDVRVRKVVGAEIDQFDPERYSFVNVNTLDDVARANRMAALLG